MSVLAELTIFPLNEGISIDDFHIEIKRELENISVNNSMTDTGICIKTDELEELFNAINYVFNIQGEKYKQFHINVKIFVDKGLKNLTLSARI